MSQVTIKLWHFDYYNLKQKRVAH